MIVVTRAWAKTIIGTSVSKKVHMSLRLRIRGETDALSLDHLRVADTESLVPTQHV
jgi:hypothetical protein